MFSEISLERLKTQLSKPMVIIAHKSSLRCKDENANLNPVLPPLDHVHYSFGTKLHTNTNQLPKYNPPTENYNYRSLPSYTPYNLFVIFYFHIF